MTKKSTLLTLLFVGLLANISMRAQNDLLKGIFEKEAPEFHTNVLSTNGKGIVKLVFYFTHSKLDELEISFWIKDNGTLMHSDGNKKLVSGLQKLGNRQQDTIYISGLKDQHVYTFGADFRKPQALSGKFSTQDLLQGYRYNYREPGSPSTARVVDAMSKSPVASPPVKPSVSCQDPIIEVRVDPGGYCGPENRPAVMVQCVNCQSKQWQFSVEVLSPLTGKWLPLRYDGKRQPAVGLGLRTEPLCTLNPGTYQVQVLAWGENCPDPVIKSLGTNIVIPHPQLEQPRASKPVAANTVSSTPKLPDTCFVEGQALLNGKYISGTLTLSPFSPCGDLRPYAEVIYVHPGHRNISQNMVPLIPGAAVPFSITLDERDLNRGIHTIQVIAYVKENENAEGIPLESFWIRATTAQELSASLNNDMVGNSPAKSASQNPQYSPPNQPYSYQESQPGSTGSVENGQNSRSASTPSNDASNDELYIDPDLMKTTINEVQVTATDPNCTPIRDLRVVFDSKQPVTPLFISWLNPRCCQVEGCSYTVWSGPDPKQLSLLMKGKKSGAVISEVLQGTNSRNQYYEVVVETGNGVRKAAYALGRGPLYGIQEILDYHDVLYPPPAAKIEAVKSPSNLSSNPSVSQSEEFESAVLLNPVIPKLPISDFEACKYRRETTLSGNQPAAIGEEITLKYDFKDSRYRFTLYHQPVGMSEWVVAPGTTELQSRPEFTFKVEPYHAGKYIILSHKNTSGGNGWGCLSTPVGEALRLDVKE